jgi:hypothetical protein
MLQKLINVSNGKLGVFLKDMNGAEVISRRLGGIRYHAISALELVVFCRSDVEGCLLQDYLLVDA